MNNLGIIIFSIIIFGIGLTTVLYKRYNKIPMNEVFLIEKNSPKQLITTITCSQKSFPENSTEYSDILGQKTTVNISNGGYWDDKKYNTRYYCHY